MKFRPITKGYVFMYEKEYFEMKDEEGNIPINYIKNKRRKILTLQKRE